MFDHTVRYFGFLKYIPVLPHLFDVMLKTGKMISGSKVPFHIDTIEEEAVKWKGVETCQHKYGGLEFRVNKKEIGHIHGNGLLDILFSSEIKKNLLLENKVSDHHVFKNSGWISFYIRNEEDVNTAIDLLRLSYHFKSGENNQESS